MKMTSSEGGNKGARVRTTRRRFNHMDPNSLRYYSERRDDSWFSVTPFSEFSFRFVNFVKENPPLPSPAIFEMCRKRLRSTWLIFLGLIYILGSAECYLVDEYDEDNVIGNENYLKLQDKLEEAPDFENKILISKREPAFTPYISIGALSNMQQFFENLKENFHSLESLSEEERKALLGKHEQSAEQETRIFRPPATAAYLHAVRNQRPSHKIRNFVANAEPSYLRGSNHYDPSYLWTGLGRRR